ncbi:uncharacterized protein LOC134251954 [Saccostrea cucullata]|uniref:uncharacterized protein LOC134251954 n=1 Tax=Saccostrea cuccullata TaxID=36930 RepID=UPI002ED20E74
MQGTFPVLDVQVVPERLHFLHGKMDFFKHFHANSMADTRNMSAFVYHCLCLLFGTSKEVEAIRDVISVINALGHMRNYSILTTGSRGEGFRTMDADLDIMYWSDDYRVIWEVHESQYYNNLNKELILCDGSESPPGFTLLYLLSQISDTEIQEACVRMKNRYYISSSKHRQIKCSTHSQSSYLHGPCVSRYHGMLEYDFAHGFASDIWPPSASSWIDRSHSWPPPHIVDVIVKSGCHFVAIGHKLGRHEHEPNEWRISFSLAEQKLVYAMNHPQFLTYGLLKLFLNSEINNGRGDDDKLLCSYHIKTAVFWAIQQNTIPFWSPYSLVDSSWICFKIILKWVYEGVCPNFFIPSNNMFLSNIHGEAQNALFTRLYKLYEMGIQSILETLSIPSCNKCIEFIRGPRILLWSNEDFEFSEADFDVKLFREINTQDRFIYYKVGNFMNFLHVIEKTFTIPLTQYHVIMLQKLISTVLQNLAFTVHMNNYTQENKMKYIADKMSRHILKFAAKFGCISDMLFLAMYHYKTFRYREALALIDVIKVKLAQPYVIYKSDVDEEKYRKAVGGQSWTIKMRKAVAWDINLNNDILFIKELRPEQQSSQQNDMHCLYIPPFVMLYMLEIFCCKHIDTIRAKAAVDNLKGLVCFDQGQHIHPTAKNISWHILGMCQQTTGNLRDALFSYQQSLKEDQLHGIQSATKMRIIIIHLRNHFKNI